MLELRGKALKGTGALLVAAALAACGEGSPMPFEPAGQSQPNFLVQAQVVTGWDFTGIIGTAAGCQDWGTSKSVVQGASTVLLTSTAGSTITSKGLELAVGETERGLGLATGGPCVGDEVGDNNVGGRLFADFSSVAAGSQLTQIDVGSVQGSATASTQEGWEIWYSTNGKGDGSTGYLLLSKGAGNGVNNVGDNIVVTGAPLPLPTANLVIRFQKNTDAPGNVGSDNDYTVKSVTTLLEEQTGCTYTIGWWKTHTGLGPQADAWPALPGGVLALGTVNYTKTQLISIFNKPPQGNGLITLAHQLIGAKLNILDGADGSAIAATITAADALIAGKVVPPVGSGTLTPASVSALVTALTNFNQGITGPGHCADEILPTS